MFSGCVVPLSFNNRAYCAAARCCVFCFCSNLMVVLAPLCPVSLCRSFAAPYPLSDALLVRLASLLTWAWGLADAGTM